jgi:protein SCO1
MDHLMRSRSLFHWLAPAAMVLLAAAGCARTAPAPVAAAEARDGYSIYELGSRWTRQDGTILTLDSLRGRPRVLALVYTHCAASCPIAIAEMKRIESRTDARVGLVLVSLDPARDPPRVLAEFARAAGLDASRWTLLAGTDADVRDLAALLDVRYRRQSASELAHSNVLTLLDADGRVVERQEGIGNEGYDMITSALALLKR